MATPLLLTRSRGEALEAEHSGAIAVMDATGKPLFTYGDVECPFFPRSAVKLFHALPFLVSGAAQKFGCSRAEIALAASSHAGEEETRNALIAWLERLGLSPRMLACAQEAPLSSTIRAKLLVEGKEPDVLHNNNAGKHLAALTDALHHGEDITNYCDLRHPVQSRLMAALGACCGLEPHTLPQAVDNCGMVAVATPLKALAYGMARLAREENLPPEYARAAVQLRQAITSAPEFLAGSKRFITQIIRLSAGRLIAKGGSEGVFVALDQRTGYGFALKVNDGSSEAASAIMLEIFAEFECLSPQAVETLRDKTRHFTQSFIPERSQNLDFPFLRDLNGRSHYCRIDSAKNVQLEGREKIILIHHTRYGQIEHVNLPEQALQNLSMMLDGGLERLCAVLRCPVPKPVRIRIIPRPRRARVSEAENCILLSRLHLPNKTALIHELTHLLLGESSLSPVLTEGMAVYLQSHLGGETDRSFPSEGQDLHELAQLTGTIKRLELDFSVSAEPEEDMAARREAYIRAGSFVRFLVERDGMEATLDLYHTRHEVMETAHKVLAEKEDDWRRFLGLN